jgi:hypothetical protein
MTKAAVAPTFEAFRVSTILAARELPRQSILEIGCGDGSFTRALSGVSRGESPITAVTFGASNPFAPDLPSSISFVTASSFPGPLQGQQFDFIVGRDPVDRRVSAAVPGEAYKPLKPSGEIVLFEGNPWNLFLCKRRSLQRVSRTRDSRSLLSRPQLYELANGARDDINLGSLIEDDAGARSARYRVR